MGKIQSVTNANVAEYVNDRKALGSEVKTPEQVAKVDQQIAGNEIKPAEPVAPEAPKDSKPDDKAKKNSVQDRIDELTRQKKELEEFSEQEYEARLQATRRISELEQQIQSIQAPPKQEVPEPKATDKAYLKEDGTVDSDKFLADWGKWNRNKAIEEFKAEEGKRQEEEAKKALAAEIEARRQNSVAAARKEFPDFDEKIEEARRSVELKKIASPNQYVQAALFESDYGAHILYHLTQHPEDVEKWNKMRPNQVAIAIGRLETQFAKPVEADSPTNTPKTKLPEPSPSLGAGGGAVIADLSQPVPFNQYKAKRLEEIRKKRR